MPKSRIFLILIIILLFTACQSTPPLAATHLPATATFAAPLSTATSLPTISPLPPTQPPELPTPAPTQGPTLPPPARPTLPRTQYHLAAVMDWSSRQTDVLASIHYANRSVDTLQELQLVFDAARRPYVVTLHQAALNGEPVSLELPTGPETDPGLLPVPLAEPLLPGQAISLTISYTLNLNAAAGRMGVTSNQTNLGDWYPFIPPYFEGQGWRVYPPSPVGEYLVYEQSDFSVDIQLLNAPPNIKVAASAPAAVDDAHYRYTLPAARTFAWSASPDYRVYTTQVDGVTVTSYSFAKQAAAGRIAGQTAAEALHLYSELYGPYPRPSLAVVEADFLDGMEYSGFFFLGQEYYEKYKRSPRNWLAALSAHETAHQWWYDQVGSDPALEPWLDEALCAYSERLFYERLHQPHLVWWWDYRVDWFQPQGWVDSRTDQHTNLRSYIDAVYLRGIYFLENLRLQIGDEAFLSTLQDYYAGVTERTAADSRTLATREDFFAALNANSPADISGLLQTYFQNP